MQLSRLKVYKFVGVNVSHPEFIKRYGRLGPRELTASGRPGDAESEAVVCTKLADALLIRDRHDPDSKTKFEVGRTKIFIRCVGVCLCVSVLSSASSIEIWMC